MNTLKSIIRKYNETNLVLRILVGMIIGIALALLVPGFLYSKREREKLGITKDFMPSK